VEPARDEHVVFLLSGPSASGKSTVGRLLARRFARGVHLEGDFFRRSIVSGRQEMAPDPSPEALDQLMLRYRLAAAAADAYFDEGFTVVFEDVIAGRLLSECAALVRSSPLHVVVLVPRPAVVVQRDTCRAGPGYAQFSVRDLYDLFLNETPRIGLWIDTSTQTPDQTVEEILAHTIGGSA
jgi:chloramphenicol 3-O-phosphotransferase